MSRILIALLLVGASLTGCIAPIEVEDAQTASSDTQAAPVDRIDGMTAEAAHEDTVETCDDVTGYAYCATRHLVVEGRLGLDALPVDLGGVNGQIRVDPGDGDAWRFEAVIKVAGQTEESAREGLDTRWGWSHETDGTYALRARPTQSAPVPLPVHVIVGPENVLYGTTYDLVLPAWVALGLEVDTSNGGIAVGGFDTSGVALDTSNGAIQLSQTRGPTLGASTSNGRITLEDVRFDDATVQTSNGGIDVRGGFADLHASSSNGAIEAVVTTLSSGKITMETSNSRVRLDVHETRERGYDLDAHTSNGGVDIDLRDGVVDQKAKNEGTFRTHGYEGRSIQTVVKLGSSNGGIDVGNA